MSMLQTNRITRRIFLAHTAALTLSLGAKAHAAEREPLPQTQPLTLDGDLAAKMVEGIDKYLMRELAESPKKRQAHWKPDYSSVEAYTKSVEPNRQRLRKILGVVDQRKPAGMEYVVTDRNGPLAIAKGEGYSVYAVRWPVFDGVDGEGLLLVPNKEPESLFIILPDADCTPEMLVGLTPGVPRELQLYYLADLGSLVLIPALMDRRDAWSGNSRIARLTNQPHREFLYRMAYEMGHHIIGCEVQKVLAVLDWFTQEYGNEKLSVLVGNGEGGLVGLCSTALDTRIKSVWTNGYFGPRDDLWQEPIYRNVWSLLQEFGPAELAMLVAPRPLFMNHIEGPDVKGPPTSGSGRSGAAPGRLTSQPPADKNKGMEPALEAYRRLKAEKELRVVSHRFTLPTNGTVVERLPKIFSPPVMLKQTSTEHRKNLDPNVRQKRQFDQLVQYTQRLMRESESRRKEFFWDKLDIAKTGGLTPPARLEAYKKSCEPLRKYFSEEVIGKLPASSLPPNPRSRLKYDEPKWKGYEVVLDVYPDVFSYGVLLVPKDIKAGERRPVVVCQHGLEGRPYEVVDPKIKSVYHSYGAQLADRGFVVFAPQNPYIGQDKFRVLQRKANPLKLSLFSFIVRQHERILDWLGTLPYVDAERIGFYGLSYGGKTAMRVPALLDRYCLSICSADFNEWIWKNASYDSPYSYVFTGEYEMFEFDLGNTFNYAEMAALIAPRPFMVERGHDDGVAPDEMVAYEYAKVRRLYAKLGIPDRTAIEFFNGGHMINGQGTFEFLHKHLNWPRE